MRTIRSAVLSLVCLSAVANGQSSRARENDRAVRSPAWLAQVSEDIRRGEYEFHALTGESGVWSAPNRSQDFRSRVSGAGWTVFPRATGANGAGAPWRLGLRTKSFGRRDGFADLRSPSISVTSSRVDLDHGLLHEWLENREDGVKHGWVIASRPAGSAPLWIGLEISGDLSMRIDEGARSASLVDACGDVQLRYRDLAVFDAFGKELDARLAPSTLGVGIQVDDGGAVYPLSVDPVLTGPAWTAESDWASAHFGYSVATAGDVNGDGYSDVIVGAYNYGADMRGRAYVYHGSASGLSTSADWTVDGSSTNAHLGISVATAGDVNGDGYSDVIVGEDLFDHAPLLDVGRALIYVGSASGLAASPVWIVEGSQAQEGFASQVAAAGDVDGDGFSDVIVGAGGHDNGQTDEGRAYVYLGSASGPSTSAAWTAESDQVAALFGGSVATAGDVNGDGFSDVIVGASSYSNGQLQEGRAYVYLGSASGLATSAAWSAESDQASSRYGASVATAGDVNGDGYSDVIVGAFQFDNGHSNEGRAFVYTGSATGLSTSAVWTVESNQANADFAYSVGTAGDVNGDGYADVIVGAPEHDNGEVDEGHASVYLGSATGLSAGAAWTAEGNQTFTTFGTSVFTAGDVDGDGYSDVIVGSDTYDNGQLNEGRAFVYHGSASGLATSAEWTVQSGQSGAQFGTSVAGAGDVNGDGYGDVVVGAHHYDNGQAGEGGAFLYLGSASGLSTTAAWTAEGNQTDAQFGNEVASAGDVNGDGYGDVIVGAWRYTNGQADEGRAFVYLGSASGLATTAAWTAESDQVDAFFGLAVGTAGDVDGDGYGDVLVGAPWFDNGQTEEGRAFLYRGSPTGLGASAAWTAESNQASAFFGQGASTAGDVNGDGYSDVVVGAYAYDNGELDEGIVFAYLGSAGGLGTSVVWTAKANQAGAAFGLSLGTAGDVNADGYSDVVVGAYAYDSGQTDEGRAFLYMGSASGLGASAVWTAESDQADARFGGSVATAGDVNGDGHSDVVVGALRFDDGEFNEGAAYVYLGSSSGLATSAATMLESNVAGADFGSSVASAGDVDGDGFGDVIVGAPSYSAGLPAQGQARVYHGNEGLSRRTLPRQQRTDGVTPIAPLGRSDSETSFRIRAIMLSVFGRTRLQMEHEAKPRGVAFDGSNTLPGSFFDIGPDGVINFNRLVTGLVPGTQYHWRVRATYDLVKTPFQRNGPWVHVPTNGWNEADLKTAGVPPPVAYCFGDGSGTACPCGNSGAAGNGCATSFNAAGAHLGSSGIPSVSADTFVLLGSGLSNSVVTYFQGTAKTNNGLGSTFGDGLRCASGAIIRLGSVLTAGGSSQYPNPGDIPISIRGQIPSQGGLRYYQVWYRNAADFCTASTFNLSNGLEVTWAP